MAQFCAPGEGEQNSPFFTRGSEIAHYEPFETPVLFQDFLPHRKVGCSPREEEKTSGKFLLGDHEGGVFHHTGEMIKSGSPRTERHLFFEGNLGQSAFKQGCPHKGGPFQEGDFRKTQRGGENNMRYMLE